MKGLLTKTKILRMRHEGWFYGIIKESKTDYVIGEVYPKYGYTVQARIKVEDNRDSKLLFGDLYRQLKSVFEKK